MALSAGHANPGLITLLPVSSSPISSADFAPENDPVIHHYGRNGAPAWSTWVINGERSKIRAAVRIFSFSDNQKDLGPLRFFLQTNPRRVSMCMGTSDGASAPHYDTAYGKEFALARICSICSRLHRRAAWCAVAFLGRHPPTALDSLFTVISTST